MTVRESPIDDQDIESAALLLDVVLSDCERPGADDAEEVLVCNETET